jgi:hypothetical protein
MKPGTFAAIPIHSRTFCSSSPRPRRIQPTWSRPPGPRRRHNPLTILAAIETFDFPHIRIDASVLQLADSLDHQAWPNLEIIGLLVALKLVELRLLRRHQEFEHEAAAVPFREKSGQAFQSGNLPPVQCAVALGIIADQHLAEGRVEGLDMLHKILAILEVELVLPALLSRTGGDNGFDGSVAKDGGAELLIHQDASFFSGHASGARRLKAIVYDLLGAGDVGGLRVA